MAPKPFGPQSDEDRAKAMRGVQGILDRFHKLAKDQPRDAAGRPQLFDYDCMNRAELVDAGLSGWVVWKFEVTQEYANLNKVMHGGAYGVLFDMFTMTALGPMARKGYWEFYTGVTRALNMSYLKAVPIGTTVYFRSHVVGVGKRVALIHGEMTNEDGSIVYATGDHHKINTPMLPEHKAARVQWDDDMDELERKEQEGGGKSKL